MSLTLLLMLCDIVQVVSLFLYFFLFFPALIIALISFLCIFL